MTKKKLFKDLIREANCKSKQDQKKAKQSKAKQKQS